MDDWSDEQLAELVRRCIRVVKAGARSSGESVKIDGVWVVVTVEKSIRQER